MTTRLTILKYNALASIPIHPGCTTDVSYTGPPHPRRLLYWHGCEATGRMSSVTSLYRYKSREGDLGQAISSPMSLNIPAPGISYFTPSQDPPAGSAVVENALTSTLLEPLTVRGFSVEDSSMVPVSTPLYSFLLSNSVQDSLSANGSSIPTLFKPLTIRGLTIHNRIMVCQLFT